MGNAARILARRLNSTNASPQTTTTDEGELTVLTRMEQRGIIRGAVRHDDGEPHGDKVLRVLREDQEWQAQYEAERARREAAQAQAALTLPELLTRAISGGENTSSHMPLNGPRVLRAALGGASGTINGQPT
jgi:hypothetical protein